MSEESGGKGSGLVDGIQLLKRIQEGVKASKQPGGIELFISPSGIRVSVHRSDGKMEMWTEDPEEALLFALGFVGLQRGVLVNLGRHQLKSQ